MISYSKYRTVLFIAVVSMIFMHCSTSIASMPDGYKVIISRSYSVHEYSAEYPKGRLLYELDKSGDTIITSIACDPEREILVVAVTDKEPRKGAARILLLKYRLKSPQLQQIETNKDRIDGMAIDSSGRIAFAAGDISHELPGEICYIESIGGPVHTLATGMELGKPAWDKDSTKVYFPYKLNSQKIIGYVEIEHPGSIIQVGQGTKVTVSHSGKLAFLNAKGEIIVIDQLKQQVVNKTDPNFADSISFVRGTEDIVIQSYKHSVVYDLLFFQLPDKAIKMLLSNVGMQDYDVYFKRD